MKILFIAVFNKHSTNWSQSDALKKNGVNVIEFDYRYIASQIGNANRDTHLIEICKTETPDLVLFSKCNEIHPNVIDECNKVSKTAIWYMDPINNQFSESLIEKIKRSTYTFCGIWDSFEKAKEIGGDKAHFLHEGFDHLSNYPIDCDYKYDVSFIGVLREHRNKYHKEVGFTVINNAFSDKHSEAVSASKINLNFTHGGTSDRTYKVLASKGFLLTEPWPNMEKDFTINEDLVIFESESELKDKITFYLENQDERLRISNNGYKTVQKFSRLNWAKKIINM